VPGRESIRVQGWKRGGGIEGGERGSDQIVEEKSAGTNPKYAWGDVLATFLIDKACG